jgi:hypothetical protein
MYGVPRWKIIAGVFVCYLIVICAFMGAITEFDVNPWKEAGPWIYAVISTAVIVASQIIFIIPMATPPKLTTKGRSLRLQMLMAGLLGTILTVVFAMLVASFITSIVLDQAKEDGWGYAFMLFSGVWILELGNIELEDLQDPMFLGNVGFIFTTWCIWSSLLWKHIKRSKHDPGVLANFTGKLFAGSLVEILLSIPLFVMVKRKTNCYCDTGSFGAMIMSVMACLWLFGPFMFIVLVWRKRPWTRTHCFACGYPRKIKKANICSECGSALN